MRIRTWRAGSSNSETVDLLLAELRQLADEHFLRRARWSLKVRDAAHSHRLGVAHASSPRHRSRPERHHSDAVRRNLLMKIVEIVAKAVRAAGRIVTADIDASQRDR